MAQSTVSGAAVVAAPHTVQHDNMSTAIAQLFSSIRPGGDARFRELTTAMRLPWSDPILGEALRISAKSGASTIAEWLLDNSVNADTADEDGQTPLMLASQAGRADLVALLIHRGADVKRTNKSGWSALFYGCAANQLQAVRALLAAGADVNTADAAGRTALDFARRKEVHWKVPIWGLGIMGRVPRLRRTELVTLLSNAATTRGT